LIHKKYQPVFLKPLRGKPIIKVVGGSAIVCKIFELEEKREKN
jgi:hypothetical protein